MDIQIMNDVTHKGFGDDWGYILLRFTPQAMCEHPCRV